MGVGQQRVDIGQDAAAGMGWLSTNRRKPSSALCAFGKIGALSDMLVDHLPQCHQAAAPRRGSSASVTESVTPERSSAIPRSATRTCRTGPTTGPGCRVQRKAVAPDKPVGGQHRGVEFPGVDVGQCTQRGRNSS